ncbi:C4-dicarboxylate ABC transporter substrate-binding protein (plasmid) [Martelella sp. AD-3]|nr:C4-dicarboxylate ABC transporter substrate-binding protein [Martelella sp. AD-3]
MFRLLLKAAALALVLGAPLAAQAREMRVSSHEPPQGFYSAQILQPWIDAVNAKLSKGNAFKLYPGAILGAPPAQAELVKAGVADVALVVPTYTPGLFPMSGVVEVPGLARSSEQGTHILSALWDKGALEKEYADYKVIALFTTPGYRLFMTGKGVTTPDQMAGLKLRTPSQFGSTLYEMLGASGVSIPAPQVYENLERGVVSGAAWVMDAYKTFRLDEVAPSITTLKFTAQPMAILMNKRTYEALPEADRAVIDAMSGTSQAAKIAATVDAADAAIEADYRAAGKVDFVALTEADMALWNDALSGAADRWIGEQSDPEAAKAVLETARKASAE